MIFGSSCFHEVFSDPPKMNSSSLYHFLKFLSLLYFSVVDFAILCFQHVCIFDSDLLKWICNVLKFYTLHFVVLMRFVVGQSGNRSYALLTLPPTAHITHHTTSQHPLNKIFQRQHYTTLLGDISRVNASTRVEYLLRFACNILFARCQNISILTMDYHV